MFDPASRAIPETREGSVFFRGPSAQSRQLNVLFEQRDDVRELRVSVMPTGLRAFLEVRVLRAEGRPTPEELHEILTDRAGVIEGIDDDALALIADLLGRGQGRVGPWQVARGRPPRIGADGGIDFLVAPSSEVARYQTDTAGRIDYRQTNRIENARQGDVIAIVRPPEAGEAGVDVFGKVLAAAPGKSFTVHLGRHVRIDEETGNCVAETDGRVVYEKRTVSVTDRYEIEGNVDLTVGDIDFVGHVVVHGNVLDEFTVRGRKSVTVEGIAGACQIWSRGPVAIRGGMNGKGEGRVVSETAGVAARYLTETQVEAEDDLVVENEIVNAIVSTHGAVRIPTGAIVGGSVTALRGVAAGRIGSDLGVVTRVAAGLDWKSEERMERIGRRLAVVEEDALTLGGLLEPFGGARRRVQRLAPERRELLKDALAELRERNQEQKDLRAELDALARQRVPDAVPQVNAERRVQAGTAVQLGAAMLQVRDPVRGPVSLVPDASSKMVRTVPIRPLAPPEAEADGGGDADNG